jgi:hypothetical protein
VSSHYLNIGIRRQLIGTVIYLVDAGADVNAVAKVCDFSDVLSLLCVSSSFVTCAQSLYFLVSRTTFFH